MMLHKLCRVVIAGLLPVGFAGCAATSTDEGDAASKQVGEDAARPCLSPDDMERMSEQLVQLTNLERTHAGLAPVTRAERLDGIATDFACRMVEQGFFAHEDPINGEGPAARASRASYRYYYIGENLAAGQTSAADVMSEWMASPDHRQIILSPKWREVGVGLRAGGEHGTYWVVEFAQPAKPIAPALQEQAPAEPVAPQAVEPVAAPVIQTAP
ncbi:MAG: CAP domain-containing protein [Phycisphaerales bacterium]|nr:CAP domain-containing protein [Phycisphaerales bacterium]